MILPMRNCCFQLCSKKFEDCEESSMRRIYKRIIFTLGIIICVLPVCGCKNNEVDQGEEIQIGISVYDEYDTFISQLIGAFMENVTAETKQGKRRISVSQYNAAGSQITQNNQVEEMINDGCDVICINLVDRTDPSMIIEMARNANVPVVFFNRELVEEDLFSWDRLYYVGADAFESGTIEGEIVAEEYKKNRSIDKNKDGYLQYVVLEGEASHQDSIVRSEYSVNALIDAGIKVDKLESSIANWNRAQAQSKMIQLIEKYGDSIELVLSNNDDMALGAIDEYEARNIPKEERPVIVGIDGTDVGLKAVKDGTMLGTVYNNKEGQARSMFELAQALATGDDLKDFELDNGKYIRYPYTKVTQGNIDDYLKEEAE